MVVLFGTETGNSALDCWVCVIEVWLRANQGKTCKGLFKDRLSRTSRAQTVTRRTNRHSRPRRKSVPFRSNVGRPETNKNNCSPRFQSDWQEHREAGRTCDRPSCEWSCLVRTRRRQGGTDQSGRCRRAGWCPYRTDKWYRRCLEFCCSGSRFRRTIVSDKGGHSKIGAGQNVGSRRPRCCTRTARRPYRYAVQRISLSSSEQRLHHGEHRITFVKRP